MILVTGSNGVVGTPLTQKLAQQERSFVSVSRKSMAGQIQWDLTQPPSGKVLDDLGGVKTLIHCAPIWLLPEHLPALASIGLARLIVFSSTSVISKNTSPDQHEQRLVRQLSEAEKDIIAFCTDHKIKYTILRPSMIYGYGRDENVSHIARFVRKRGFMLLVGKANGLRQPVHADDLVWSALTVMQTPITENKIYNLAGAEVLSYRQMVTRVFQGLEKTPRIISLPLGAFRVALKIAKLLTKFQYTPEMANRMNQDLAYSNHAAQDDFAFKPQNFLEQPRRDLL